MGGLKEKIHYDDEKRHGVWNRIIACIKSEAGAVCFTSKEECGRTFKIAVYPEILKTALKPLNR